MARWLVKSDPDEYSAADLERDKATVWTGVKNALAQRHLRAMRPRDVLLVYHTGSERAIVALAKVGSAPQVDPTDRGGKLVAVELRFDRWLPNPVSLAQLKADRRFANFILIRQGRLSVMPVTDQEWEWMLALAQG